MGHLSEGDQRPLGDCIDRPAEDRGVPSPQQDSLTLPEPGGIGAAQGERGQIVEAGFHRLQQRKKGVGAFETSEQAYNTLYIGGPRQAAELQAKSRE